MADPIGSAAGVAPDGRSRTRGLRWWAGVPAPAVDTGVAAATALAAVVLLVISDEADRQAPDAMGAALLVLAAAPLAMRRRWPAAALGATAVTTIVYLTLGYAGGPTTVPVLVALYSSAARGRRVPALLVVGFFVGVGSAQRLVVQRDPFTTVAFQGLLYVFAWLVGELVCSRRALRAETEARLQQAADEREREAQRRVRHERVRIARELHDVMAHTVSTMTVQAGVAADLLDDRPDQARASLQAVRRAGREAMAELRATVSLLRGDDGDQLPPAPGLADLDALVERVAADGVSVRRVTTGQPRPLPAAVELTGYRIVQEALTNVVRHAGAATAVVALGYERDGLTVEVVDDGRGAGGHVHASFGLLGMRERAEAVGGRLEAGTRADGGFRVRGYLPAGDGTR